MKDILIDFGLPALLITFCFVLLITGKDGEVKSIMVLAAGWILNSGYHKTKRK